MTGQAKVHRGLVFFNLEKVLPKGFAISAAKLSLYLNRAPNSDPSTISLHRALRDWGEGTSNSGGGSCAAATPEVRRRPARRHSGPSSASPHSTRTVDRRSSSSFLPLLLCSASHQQDATWLYAFFGAKDAWQTAGGDYANTTSAAAVAAAENTRVTFQGPRGKAAPPHSRFQHEAHNVVSTSLTTTLLHAGPGLLADVKAWVANPQSNHGWLIRGNETQVRSSPLLPHLLRAADVPAIHRPTVPRLVFASAPGAVFKAVHLTDRQQQRDAAAHFDCRGLPVRGFTSPACVRGSACALITHSSARFLAPRPPSKKKKKGSHATAVGVSVTVVVVVVLLTAAYILRRRRKAHYENLLER